MKDFLSRQDIEDSRALLEQLCDEVRAEETTLAGGTDLYIGAKTLQSFRETRLACGNPVNDLIKLTEALFHEIGITLHAIPKRQMRTSFDFYYMTLPLTIYPGRNVKFKRVECVLDFGPKGVREPVVQAIFPGSEWKEVLSLGGGVNLGLDGKLQWQMGVDSKAIAKLATLPGKLQAKVANKGSLSAYIAIPNYKFEVGFTEIFATGEGNSECFWRIEDPGLKKRQTVKLGVVFKVPKATTQIELRALAAAEPDFNWLTASLRNVFQFLSAKLQRLLRLREEKRDGKNRLPIGAHEAWTLQLPQ